MGAKTKIDWCDATFNPVTGCEHDCDYCYARRIAERFKGWDGSDRGNEFVQSNTGLNSLMVLNEPQKKPDGRPAPYPFGFTPTFHKYMLDEPQSWKKHKNVFVCSMADLFGDWAPDEWIEQVFNACKAAPQHRYLFLTKNPKRYVDLYRKGLLDTSRNYWYGSTVTDPDMPFYYSCMPDDNPHTFVSIEPLLKPIEVLDDCPEWIIIGAETGNRKDKVIPERAWVETIVKTAKRRGAKIFMKESLRELMGEDFVQEFPW